MFDTKCGNHVCLQIEGLSSKLFACSVQSSGNMLSLYNLDLMSPLIEKAVAKYYIVK